MRRSHDDWKGVHFDASEEAIFLAFPLPPEEEDTDDNDHNDGSDTGNQGHGTRQRGRLQQKASEELLKKKERIGNLRSQMFEILNVLDTLSLEDFNETHAPSVETAVSAIRQSLPVFPLRTISTVAKRPAGQKAKGSARRKRAAAPETAGRGGGGAVATRPSVAIDDVTVVGDDVSDVPEDVPEANFRWNPMTQRYEYRSTDASDESDSDESATGPPQQQHRNRMYLTADGSAWYIDSQPGPNRA